MEPSRLPRTHVNLHVALRVSFSKERKRERRSVRLRNTFYCVRVAQWTQKDMQIIKISGADCSGAFHLLP